MKRQIVLMFVAVVMAAAGLAAIVANLGPLQTRETNPDVAAAVETGWTEVDWPYLKDQFGAGRAYRCRGPNCGRDLRVTFRAKIGFCNCATGVADDEELERIGDVGLAGDSYAAGQPGREIRVGEMKGRDRAYVSSAGGAPPLLSLAFNNRCDVIVATATGPSAIEAEQAILDFLNSAPVLNWAERALGL